MCIGENIARLRRARGWTQAELGEKLGVSNQAVSKWESGMTMPDIMLLPTLADMFGIYIDELFSREVKTQVTYSLCAELPWADDGVIRGVVYDGRKLLKHESILDKFTFEITGEAKKVQSECNIEVNGNVSGGCSAGMSITVSGTVSGGCQCAEKIIIGGNLSGGCNTGGGDITIGGSLSGGCNTGGDITCGGDLSGDVNCGDTITVSGSVDAKRIQGNVVCNFLKCERIEGGVTINQVD